MTADKFTSKILSRLTAEYGASDSQLQHLVPRIEEACATESHVTDEQITAMLGGDVAVEREFPKLADVFTLASLEERDEDDEDEDDEDDEDEDEEVEDDDD